MTSIDHVKVKEFFAYCNENEVEFIDFRFTDIKGIGIT